MNRNVLVLSASPRKNGNSNRLCDQFILGAKKQGHQVEKIEIHEQNINYCIGCGACQVHAGVCVQKDDMEVIMEKMVQADVIVMATPVYFYSMNGQMKTLIDRLCPRYNEISNKDFYLILTAADSSQDSLKHTLDGFYGFFDCLDNPTIAGIVYGVNANEIGEIEKTSAMSEAYEMGANIK